VASPFLIIEFCIGAVSGLFGWGLLAAYMARSYFGLSVKIAAICFFVGFFGTACFHAMLLLEFGQGYWYGFTAHQRTAIAMEHFVVWAPALIAFVLLGVKFVARIEGGGSSTPNRATVAGREV